MSYPPANEFDVDYQCYKHWNLWSQEDYVWLHEKTGGV